MVVIVRSEDKKKILLKEVVGSTQLVDEKVIDGRSFYKIDKEKKLKTVELISQYHYLDVEKYDENVVFIHDKDVAGNIKRTLYVRSIEQIEWIETEHKCLLLEWICDFMFVKDIDINKDIRHIYSFIVSMTKISASYDSLNIEEYYPNQIILYDLKDGSIKNVYYLKCYEWYKFSCESESGFVFSERYSGKSIVNIMTKKDRKKVKLCTINIGK